MKRKHHVARSSKEVSSQATFRTFVDHAKAQLPYSVIWESNAWEVGAEDSTKRAHLDHLASLYFTEHAPSRAHLRARSPFEQAYADLVKSCIVHRRITRGVQSGVQRVFVRASRYIYHVCALPVRRDPTLITRHHFVAAEADILKREKSTSAYKAGQMLEEFAKTLDRFGITRAPLDYRCSIPRPANVNDRTSSTFQERAKRLPSPKAIDALADIGNSARLHEWWFDILRMRLVDLLLVCGFRIGELLSIPEKPLVREIVLDDDGEPRRDALTGEVTERVGVRYWPEKGGEPIVKWVPTVANALVVRAIEDLDRFCKDARDNAKWLERNPGIVRVEINNSARLSLIQVAGIVGIKQGHSHARQWFRQRNRGGTSMIRHIGRRAFVLGSDLMSALASDRYDKPVVSRSGVAKQTLGSSLLVLFMHDVSSRRPTNRYISVPVTWMHVNDFVCGRAGTPSIFERFGQLDIQGRPFRITTHDFRRILNTMAQKGGLSQIEIARWMGRRRVEDNAAYDYRSVVDLAEELRPLIERNEVFGEITKQVQSLPEAERSVFLKSRLAMVHRTPLGMCGSTIAENPCTTAVSCLGGCRHFLRRKGDAKSRDRLLKLEQQTIEALERARTAAREGKHNAQNWVHAQETVLNTIRAALAIDGDPNVAPDQMVAVNPDGPILGEPL